MTSTVTRHQLSARSVGGTVVYDLVEPAEPSGHDVPMPVLVWLHGGDGPDRFVERTRPAFDDAWRDGSLPPCRVVAPHGPRLLWADGVAPGSAWETMLTDELVPHAATAHGGNGTVAIGGISMGGLGALRAALRRPERFAAVIALEPAIEPTPEWCEVSRRDRFYRGPDVTGAVFGDPVDPDRFRAAHPIAIAEAHAVAIAASGLAIYLECGDVDSLRLHHGAEALHRTLWDLGLVHEYRSVRGGDHVGAPLGPRTRDALAFLGRVLHGGVDGPADDPARDQLRAGVRELERAGGHSRRSVVAGPAGPIEVHESGDGDPVVLLPSLGRGAADFEDLAGRLADAGHHVLCPEPRGINGSTGDLTALTMADLAADVAAVLHARTDRPATLVGHAFGNRVARMTATDYPHLVDSVVLLACGGLVKPAPEHAQALLDVFDVEASADDHLEAVRTAFFAAGNDPSAWFDGWHGAVAAAQGAATTNQPVEHWWGAGGKELFVVQPAEDVMAVPANAEALVGAFPHRASMVTIDHAGHALLPEQPEAVAVAVRSWLNRR